MKDFVLYSSLEIPHDICAEEFERCTKSEFPFKQTTDGKNHYYATCPECENTIQLRGLYNGERRYGAHAGKDIRGFTPFNYDNYIFCPRSVQGRHVPKDYRKNICSEKDISIYNTIRENFDLAVAFAKKHLGYYISDTMACRCLEIYVASQGWLYPYSTVNNIPFMIFYLPPAINPYGLLIRKNSLFEEAVLKCSDLQLVPIQTDLIDENRNSNIAKHYSKLLPNSKKYMSLTMMLWNHKFKENNDGILEESINIQICKDVSRDRERHDWKTLLDIKVDIPELEFVKFVNADNVYRNEALRNRAQEIMPALD